MKIKATQIKLENLHEIEINGTIFYRRTKHLHERKSCFGKIKHESSQASLAAIIEINKKTNQKLDFYECDYCQKSHIGHLVR